MRHCQCLSSSTYSQKIKIVYIAGFWSIPVPENFASIVEFDKIKVCRQGHYSTTNFGLGMRVRSVPLASPFHPLCPSWPKQESLGLLIWLERTNRGWAWPYYFVNMWADTRFRGMEWIFTRALELRCTLLECLNLTTGSEKNPHWFATLKLVKCGLVKIGILCVLMLNVFKVSGSWNC